MSETYTCILRQDVVELNDIASATTTTMDCREFEALTPRRQRAKLACSARLAGGLWQHYGLRDRLEQNDADPQNTPLLVLNRYANWDYVAQMMCSDIAVTLEAVNSYVATAWFPASLQGFLTIAQGNKAEALTLATRNIHLQAAALDSLFQRTQQGEKAGLVMVATFESLPSPPSPCAISQSNVAAFGAFSLVSSAESATDILTTLAIHKELYRYV